jgi:hypothetical protein
MMHSQKTIKLRNYILSALSIHVLNFYHYIFYTVKLIVILCYFVLLTSLTNLDNDFVGRAVLENWSDAY